MEVEEEDEEDGCGVDGLSLRRLRTGFIVENHDL